ncbi:hypothetical protein TUM4261_35780 [Shewanella sp. c952]|nr:hypothetical protein TUM4261_35780 [Shewanella sp. c952]
MFRYIPIANPFLALITYRLPLLRYKWIIDDNFINIKINLKRFFRSYKIKNDHLDLILDLNDRFMIYIIKYDRVAFILYDKLQ